MSEAEVRRLINQQGVHTVHIYSNIHHTVILAFIKSAADSERHNFMRKLGPTLDSVPNTNCQ